MVIEHGDAVFLHLFDEHGLLLAAVEFQEGAGFAGQGVPLEVPAAEGTHVDAPFLPLLHDVEAFQKMQAHKLHVLGLADKASQEFLKNRFDVITMNFRAVAGEMVVARGSRAGSLHIAFFENHDSLGPGFRRSYGGHGAANASAYDDHIGFNGFGNRNHDFASWGLRASALM